MNVSQVQTAYPRLKLNPHQRDLDEVFTPTLEEIHWADELTKSEVSRLGFLVLLKTFQRLGYFVTLKHVPSTIIEHIARCLGFLLAPTTVLEYDRYGMRATHISLIRSRFEVRPFNAGGQTILEQAVRRAAQRQEDLRDLVNTALEELTRARFELPGYTTLFKEAQRGRNEVNDGLHQKVFNALTLEDRVKLERLFSETGEVKGTKAWHRVKKDPGRPSLKNLKKLMEHHTWLQQFQPSVDISRLLPDAKLRQFAADADSMDAARMADLEPVRRDTLAAALVTVKAAQALDDLADVFIKRLSDIHRSAKEALETYQREHRERTDQLIATLKSMLIALTSQNEDTAQMLEIRTLIAGREAELLEQCEAHEAVANGNYLPFVWRFYSSHRAILFELARVLPLRATSLDTSLLKALELMLEHQPRRGDWLTLEPLGGQPALDLAWVSDPWWRLLTDQKRRTSTPERVNRRHFEVCVFTRLWNDLKSGDVCLTGSLEYADYRERLIDDATYQAAIGAYALEVGLPVSGEAFVAHVQAWLDHHASDTDLSFPSNDALRFENGRPVLTRLKATPVTSEMKSFDTQLISRLEETNLLDAITDVQNITGLTHYFGPISGFESKLEQPVERYLATIFCYGCNLGPAQTARSLPGANRRDILWVNARHVTEEDLERATTHVINQYNRFLLPKFWGDGSTVSADGTQWDVYQGNLLTEYHIRYGGYGGIGYYHVSDTYIALFSRFIPCGVYEAVYILDGLLENESEIQPDTVHSDTHGQSEAVFGLSYLLGIDLMPRIRDWGSLRFYRPTASSRYEHIDELFSEVIDWALIKRYLPDMLRVVLSIRAGRIAASTILKRLSTFSRKNQVYLAFRELGRAVRTGFLLRYIGDPEMRKGIQGAMNKSEQFNKFLQWSSFGGDELRSNDRDLLRKIIKYQHLVANCLIFYNVMAFTRVLKDMRAEGFEVSREVLERISPYRTEHLNRLGEYRLDLSREIPDPNFEYEVLPVKPVQDGKKR